MGKQSKNARTGSKTDILQCTCGGTIKMHTVMEKGKMYTYAECDSCSKKAKKPKELMRR
jgi:hypothetical protein